MEYTRIVSVSGLPGLYELINNKPDGAVVRSLDDQTTRFASARIHNFSHLETIEVYTVGENVNLADVFQAMEKEGGELPDTKDNSVMKKYFQRVYPEIDFGRVYNSDLKKMIKWYEVLKKNKIEIKLSEPEEVEPVSEEETEAPEEDPQTKKTTQREPSKKEKKSSREKTGEKAQKKPAASKGDKSSKKPAAKKKK